MSKLQSVIEKAANDFAQVILAAIRDSSLKELLSLQSTGSAPHRGRRQKSAKPGPKPKSKPRRKLGRPSKAVVKKTAKKATVAKAAKGKSKIKWPKCSVEGCKRNAWARGNGMCGEHFKASKAK